MSFPTLPVLDDFNTIENPISHGGDWTNGSGGAAGLSAADSVCYSTSGIKDAVWKQATNFGPNIETFMDLRANGGTNKQIGWLDRWDPVANSWLSMAGVSQFSGSGVGQLICILSKRVAGVDTTLATLAPDVDMGEPVSPHTESRVGWNIIGDTITLYVDGVSVGSVGGANAVPAAGRKYIFLEAGWQIDTYGGGTLTSGAPTLTQLVRGSQRAMQRAMRAGRS
jgi:hypothetical protein